MLEPNQLAKRVLVLTNQLGHVARDIQHFVVQGDTDFAPQNDGEERLARSELDEDMADLITQVRQLCIELGYNERTYQELVELGLKRMAVRRAEYEARGWMWI